MLQDRLPSISNQIADILDGAQAPGCLGEKRSPLASEISTILEVKQVRERRGCLGELQLATQVLDRNGFVSHPGWFVLQGRARPPHQHGSEPGEWPHGWQYFASSASGHHFRETVVLAQSCAAHQAHLRSHSGAGAINVLCGCPTAPEIRITPLVFRTIVCERLRLPLGCVGPLWSSSHSVSTFRDVAISGNGSRENGSVGVSGGRSHCEYTREAPRS